MSILSSFLKVRIPYHEPKNLPGGTQTVLCRIENPDHSPCRDSLTMELLCNETHWQAECLPAKPGYYPLPVPDPVPKEQKVSDSGYLLLLSGHHGYRILRSPQEIYPQQELRLLPGCDVKIHWKGRGLQPFSFSLENIATPEFSRGHRAHLQTTGDSTAVEYHQESPGIALLTAIFYPYPGDPVRKDAVFLYSKFLEIPPQPTLDVELGTDLIPYRIKCLLPPNANGKVMLYASLPPSGALAHPIRSLIFAPRILGTQAFHQRVASGYEEWSFDAWPMDEQNEFHFFAHRRSSAITISMRNGQAVIPLATVDMFQQTPDLASAVLDLTTNATLQSDCVNAL